MPCSASERSYVSSQYRSGQNMKAGKRMSSPLLDYELVPERVEGCLERFDRGRRPPLPPGVSRVMVARSGRDIEKRHALAGGDLEKFSGERVCGDMNRAGPEMGPRLADEWCVFAQMTTRKSRQEGRGTLRGEWSPRPLADEEHSRRCARPSAITKSRIQGIA
jgi:hypothetical protein